MCEEAYEQVLQDGAEPNARAGPGELLGPDLSIHDVRDAT
jgi:hypothetical protein